MKGGTLRQKQFYDIKYLERTIRYEVKNTFFPNERNSLFGVIVKVDESILNSIVPPTNFSHFNKINPSNTKKNVDS